MTVFKQPAVQAIANALRRFPATRALLDTNAYRTLRHRIAYLTEPRTNFITSRFLRLPSEYAALAGPVVDALAPAGTARELEVVVLACSVGAEPYSLASVLLQRSPNLRFTVRAYDIDAAVLARARAARYSAKDLFPEDGLVTPEFAAATFDREGEDFVVKPAIRRRVEFGIADLLDPKLRQVVGTADIVLAQNVLYNFKPAVARRAFANLVTLLRPGSYLGIDGMDLGMRERLTRAYGLVPLDYRVEEIHNEARTMLGRSWPWHYYGLEPFDRSHRHWLWRYARLFFNPQTARSG